MFLWFVDMYHIHTGRPKTEKSVNSTIHDIQ